MRDSFIKGLVNRCTLKKNGVEGSSNGQGVVEYAGALVVAALLIAAVIAVAPFGISETFTSILSNITKTLTSKL